MKTMYGKKIFTAALLTLLLSAGLYSCKCAKCLTIPPAVAPDAIALQNINHLIDTATANAWVARYVANRNNISNNMVGTFTNILPYGEEFNKKYMLKLLCIKKCIGIKVAYGMDTNYKVHQIICGVGPLNQSLYINDPELGACKVEYGMPCSPLPCQ